jgi:hypothetical protein
MNSWIWMNCGKILIMSLNSGIFSSNIFDVKLEIYLFTAYESYAMINLKCIFFYKNEWRLMETLRLSIKSMLKSSKTKT